MLGVRTTDVSHGRHDDAPLPHSDSGMVCGGVPCGDTHTGNQCPATSAATWTRRLPSVCMACAAPASPGVGSRGQVSPLGIGRSRRNIRRRTDVRQEGRGRLTRQDLGCGSRGGLGVQRYRRDPQRTRWPSAVCADSRCQRRESRKICGAEC